MHYTPKGKWIYVSFISVILLCSSTKLHAQNHSWASLNPKQQEQLTHKLTKQLLSKDYKQQLIARTNLLKLKSKALPALIEAYTQTSKVHSQELIAQTLYDTVRYSRDVAEIQNIIEMTQKPGYMPYELQQLILEAVRKQTERISQTRVQSLPFTDPSESQVHDFESNKSRWSLPSQVIGPLKA